MRGNATLLGDDISTDLIYPGQFCTIHVPEEMASHAMHGLDPGWAASFKAGDFIVAGRNFGCGSSREQAVLSLRHLGVAGILCVSVARIFMRNCINNGLPIIELPTMGISQGDEVNVDLQEGSVKVVGQDGALLELEFRPFGDYIRSIIEAGGILAATKQELELVQLSTSGT